ncbi:hypothetical protein FNB79_11220 [Formosa sediminum]|uniref:Uncharacterized protein n=1 Tax=Formosa sediminum TaxID=2594004 RepID=A0A516GSL5_9FLAO|nr:hypothetical protein [Formosa sediminum]QDO94511.1 hypothetical protein FNB79_11220 [Formosa sediminum]
MTTKMIQDQLANQISNSNKTWGNLLAKLELGNTASSYWDVKLNSNNILVNSTKKNFKFKNVTFTFDVNTGVSYGDNHQLFTKQISGAGSFQILHTKTIMLETLILDEN